MTKDRSAPVLGHPPADLSGFPRRTVRRNRRLRRAHARANGPWWFSGDLTGRLDLPAPDGTCYLAEEAATALRERLGPRILHRGLVSRGFIAETVVSTLTLPWPHRVADCARPAAADFTATTELSTCDYPLGQEWAAALHATGLAGVRYLSSFAPSGTNVAVFGAAGSRDGDPRWGIDPAPVPGEDAALAAGLTVVAAAPSARTLSFVAPPASPSSGPPARRRRPGAR